jgi:calcium-dependent protein kinase
MYIITKTGLSKNYPLGEAEIKVTEIFEEVDFNNDGIISFSEFLTVTVKKEKLLSEEMLRRAFDLFDIDGNGYITIDEFKENMPLEVETAENWIEIINEVDKDGDGVVLFFNIDII